MARVTRDLTPVTCEKCNGTGSPLFVAGDPTSGNDASKTCDACDGLGYTPRLSVR